MLDISDFKNPANILQDKSIQQTRDHVIQYFNEKHDPRLVYHNFQRTAEIDKTILELGVANRFDETTIQIARQACLFYGLGYLADYKQPVNKAMVRGQNFLRTRGYETVKINRVINALVSMKKGTDIVTKEAQLLSDAINTVEIKETFMEERPLLRVEWELFSSRYITDVEWAQQQLQHLLNTKYYTPEAKIQAEPILARIIKIQKQKLEKIQNNQHLEKDEEGRVQKFQNLERKLPERATQTFFRTNYRNHINLSAIADNKANIMISVNAIMISVLISLLTYKNVTDSNPMVLLPIVIFLITGLTSLIFAVLSIRPKITAVNEAQKTAELAKKNIVFFGNFVHLSLEQYEEAMDAMFRDSQLLYGNMTRDLYYLGKVLDKKYRFLTISYNIFMVGFVAVVVSFLFILLS